MNTDEALANDNAQVPFRPPIVWGLALAAGLALNWIAPWRLPAGAWPGPWIGAATFALALGLFVWAAAAINAAGSNLPSNRPTTTIVATGPYRFTRNPIYLSMFLGQVGLALGFDDLWLLALLVPFALLIRYAVVAREEAYLERKFGEAYRRYRASVRRWL